MTEAHEMQAEMKTVLASLEKCQGYRVMTTFKSSRCALRISRNAFVLTANDFRRRTTNW